MGFWRERLRERWAQRMAEGAVDAEAAALPAGANVEADLAYGPDPAQRLDLYRPAAATGGAPVILYLHGGGWQRGDKAMPRLVARKAAHWTSRGTVFASANYRLLPRSNVLEQADDVARAIAFVQANAAAWGADASRLGVVGHSAGAHLLALVTADADIAMRFGARPWRASVILDTAALDIPAVMERPHFRFYDPVFGDDPAFWHAASPMHRLQGLPAAPMLLVYSTLRADSGGPAEAFAARVVALGGRASTLGVALGHCEINDDLGAPGAYTEAVDGFLRDPAAS